MGLNFEKYIIEIVESCSCRLGGSLDISTLRPIGSPASKERVADATQAFFVDGKSREDDCVLILSNPRFPEMVDQAVSKALDAQFLLGSALGEAVCTPRLTGRWGEQSYAVYQRLIGYSDNRHLRRAQVLASSKGVFDWLLGVFKATSIECVDRDERDHRFTLPLRVLSRDDSLDSLVRESAATLEGQLCRGEARTFKCLQHGDFWFGNILFFRGSGGILFPDHKRFQVIDWGGSILHGYPGIDALRFAISSFGKGAMASERVRLFSESISISKVEFSLSCFCALGWLASNLDQFPKSRFNELALTLCEFLNRHGFLDAKSRS